MPSQLVRPAGHSEVHSPERQKVPKEQASKHPPQWLRSVRVLTQTSPQRVRSPSQSSGSLVLNVRGWPEVPTDSGW